MSYRFLNCVVTGKAIINVCVCSPVVAIPGFSFPVCVRVKKKL